MLVWQSLLYQPNLSSLSGICKSLVPRGFEPSTKPYYLPTWGVKTITTSLTFGTASGQPKNGVPVVWDCKMETIFAQSKLTTNQHAPSCISIINQWGVVFSVPISILRIHSCSTTKRSQFVKSSYWQILDPRHFWIGLFWQVWQPKLKKNSEPPQKNLVDLNMYTVQCFRTLVDVQSLSSVGSGYPTYFILGYVLFPFHWWKKDRPDFRAINSRKPYWKWGTSYHLGFFTCYYLLPLATIPQFAEIRQKLTKDSVLDGHH